MPSRYQPNITATPTKLVQADGSAICGLFDGSVPELNFADLSQVQLLNHLLTIIKIIGKFVIPREHISKQKE